jgi:uncharacterized OB-fold protein
MTNKARSGVSLTTTFEYAHPLGALAPYFEALTEGRALGAGCLRCMKVWFPPRIVCTCGEATVWEHLPGSGTIEVVTAGPGMVPMSTKSGDLVFALVRFDGADNLALVRCEAADTLGAGTRGRLTTAANRSPHPASAAVFETALVLL